MNPYDACSQCACYVKRSDKACPFCRATKGATSALLPARPAFRRSRAQWLACGSTLALVGCSSAERGAATAQKDAGSIHVDAPSTEDARGAAVADGVSEFEDAAMNAQIDGANDVQTAQDGSGDALNDGPLDAIATDAARDGNVSFASAHGRFPCTNAGAGTTCDRATQWCYGYHGGFSYSCQPLDTNCLYSNLAADGGCTDPLFNAAACNGGYRRCACVTSSCGNLSCVDDDAGGVTISCGTCYGSPPARLDRFRASSREVLEGRPLRTCGGRHTDGVTASGAFASAARGDRSRSATT
jgi:hypothetical protein